MDTNVLKLIGHPVTPVFPFGFIGRPWDNFYRLENYDLVSINQENWYCFNLGSVQIFVDLSCKFLVIDDNIFIITDRFAVKMNDRLQRFSRGAIGLIGAPMGVERAMADIIYAMNGAIKLSAKIKP